MRIACEDSIIERQLNGNDEWLKEFIHLYFHSKYARTGYQVDGKPCSLKDDTDIEGKDGFDVVQKYIDIINPEKIIPEVKSIILNISTEQHCSV